MNNEISQNPSKIVLVVGAGAAGLMAAGRLSERGFYVRLVEKNNMVGKKLMITGKGRCNVTSHLDISDFFSQVPKNEKFLYSAFYSFTNLDMIELLKRYGIETKVERGERVFPVSDRAKDVVDALESYAVGNRTVLLQDEIQSLCVENGMITGAIGKNGRKIDADAVIIATGGASYPRTGSTGDGYRLAESVGHTIVPIKPSLVPLVTGELTKDLMGLSLKNVAITLMDEKNKSVYEDFGEMLFTHFGVSGPIILSASAHMRTEAKYHLSIDLKPALSEEKLDERILRDFEKYHNKHFVNALSDLLPQKLIPYIIERTQIEEHKVVNQITQKERQTLVDTMKHLTFSIRGVRPIEEAIVTSGGVSVKEVNPSTMESKKVAGLYFAGEVLDVDAYTGGFNLQIAFSTGYLAADSIPI